MREIFCSMRIHPDLSMTCLLFDCYKKSLEGLVGKLLTDGVFRWQHPLSFLSLLVKECGCTSEEGRRVVDHEILGAEYFTMSSPWGTPSTEELKQLSASNESPGPTADREPPKVPIPETTQQAVRSLHVARSKMVFVSHAVAFEIDSWRFLQAMMSDVSISPLLKMAATDGEWQSMMDDVEFELMYTLERQAQIAGLRERIGVQIQLVCLRSPIMCVNLRK